MALTSGDTLRIIGIHGAVHDSVEIRSEGSIVLRYPITVLRAYVVKERLLRRLKIVSKTTPED